jgi:hypothetical protein
MKNLKEALRKIIRQELQERKISAPSIPAFENNMQLANYLNKWSVRKQEFLNEYSNYIYTLPNEIFSNEVEICKNCVNIGNKLDYDYDEGWIGIETLGDACVIRGTNETLVFSLEDFSYPSYSHLQEFDEIYLPKYFTEEIDFGPNIIYVDLWEGYVHRMA